MVSGLAYPCRTAWAGVLAGAPSGIAIAYENEIRAYYPDGSHMSLGLGRQWSGCVLSMHGNMPVAVTETGQVAWPEIDDPSRADFGKAHQATGAAVTISGSSILSAGADGCHRA